MSALTWPSLSWAPHASHRMGAERDEVRGEHARLVRVRACEACHAEEYWSRAGRQHEHVADVRLSVRCDSREPRAETAGAVRSGRERLTC